MSAYSRTHETQALIKPKKKKEKKGTPAAEGSTGGFERRRLRCVLLRVMETFQLNGRDGGGLRSAGRLDAYCMPVGRLVRHTQKKKKSRLWRKKPLKL